MERNEVKVILTKEEAISLLGDRETIHNFINAPFGIMGSDRSREYAIEKINEAVQLEIGGDNCKRMGHGLVVRATDKRPYFVEVPEADIDKMENEKIDAMGDLTNLEKTL